MSRTKLVFLKFCSFLCSKIGRNSSNALFFIQSETTVKFYHAKQKEGHCQFFNADILRSRSSLEKRNANCHILIKVN